jgi:hypothetical protein
MAVTVVGVKRAALLLLTVGALSGCGGDDGGGERLTREEYAAQADVICARFKERVEAAGNPANLSELADAADAVLPSYEKSIDDLRELRPPERDEETADQWLDQLEVVKDDLTEIRDQARAGDDPGLSETAVRAQQNNMRAEQLATRLGMSVCNTG